MIEGEVIEALRTVYDPEIPVDIYELGLIYDINVEPSGVVHVTMTLTSPACPAAGMIPIEVEEKIRAINGVTDVDVDIVWEPPWTPERMSEAARLELGFF
jgi:FeS assembly SUF system protein